MADVKFLSDDWFAALAAAAEARTPPADDPLAEVSVVIEQRVHDGPRWQIVIDHGAMAVRVDPDADSDAGADVRLTSDRATAAAIAAGDEAALDAFMVGRLMVGGDVHRLVEHRAALEALGDVFASVRAATDFD